jgi:hypothetical protein
MGSYAEIRATLSARPRWQLVGFAAGCGERLLPMAASLGGASMAEAARTGLALAWEAAAGLGVSPRTRLDQVLAELTQVVDEAPDGGLGLLGAHAANVSLFAVEAAAGSSPTDRAQVACGGAMDLAGEVDATLSRRPIEESFVSTDDEERPPGQRRREEIEAQLVSLRLLDTGDRPDVRAIEAVRQLSQAQARELAQLMPEFAQLRGQAPT